MNSTIHRIAIFSNFLKLFITGINRFKFSIPKLKFHFIKDAIKSVMQKKTLCLHFELLYLVWYVI